MKNSFKSNAGFQLVSDSQYRSYALLELRGAQMSTMSKRIELFCQKNKITINALNKFVDNATKPYGLGLYQGAIRNYFIGKSHPKHDCLEAIVFATGIPSWWWQGYGSDNLINNTRIEVPKKRRSRKIVKIA